MLLVLLIPALAVACGGSGAATGGTAAGAAGGSAAAPPVRAAVAEERLWLKGASGEPVPFENGRSVTIAGVTAEIYVSPYPPGRNASIDFYLTRNRQPLEGANVTLQYDMTVMAHGPFQLRAAPTGRGHYLAPLEFEMTGDFWLNVSVDAGGEESVINMFVRAVR